MCTYYYTICTASICGAAALFIQLYIHTHTDSLGRSTKVFRIADDRVDVMRGYTYMVHKWCAE